MSFSVHNKSYMHSHVSSSVLLLYWLFYSVAHLVRLRTLIKIGSNPFQFSIFLISMILVLIVFVLELLPKPQSDYELIDGDESVIIHFIQFSSFVLFIFLIFYSNLYLIYSLIVLKNRQISFQD